MPGKVCSFGDIQKGYPFSSLLASYWKIEVVWGKYGPNNAMRQDNGVKVCFADVQLVTPIVRGDPDFSTVESAADVASVLTGLRYYRCPRCKQVWSEFDLVSSEGNCLTEPEKCGWEDELNVWPVL